MTYKICRAVIINQLADGSLDRADMADKLDVFLLNHRISDEEYGELMTLMEDGNE